MAAHGWYLLSLVALLLASVVTCSEEEPTEEDNVVVLTAANFDGWVCALLGPFRVSFWVALGRC